MLARRIIPCLDVKNNKVVKGVQFRHHRIMGDILPLAEYYCQSGADELVFYDITASADARTVSHTWVSNVAKKLNIPFCVAGGIKGIDDARKILESGADKISINSFALLYPDLIDQLAGIFGSQCVVIGVDSKRVDDDYYVHQYTGSVEKTLNTQRKTLDWVKEVQQRGAGEIVLNCMDADGTRDGYDIEQLNEIRSITTVPLIASGGAGNMTDFYQVFSEANVDGALAASIFHNKSVHINELKTYLAANNVEIRV